MAENEKKTPETVEAADTKKVEKADTKAVKVKKDKPSFFSRAAAWLRTTKAELKKIAWTPRKMVLKNTGLVLAAMVLLAAIIGLLDYAFSSGIYGLSQII